MQELGLHDGRIRDYREKCKLPVVTQTGNTPDHLFDHSTFVSLRKLDFHLLSQEILRLHVLRPRGLNREERKFNAQNKLTGIIPVPSIRHLSTLSWRPGVIAFV
jgi:hypothetical protein